MLLEWRISQDKEKKDVIWLFSFLLLLYSLLREEFLKQSDHLWPQAICVHLMLYWLLPTLEWLLLMLYWLSSQDLLRHSGEILIQIRHTTSFKSIGFKSRTEILAKVIVMGRWEAMHSNIFKVFFFNVREKKLQQQSTERCKNFNV